MGGGGPPAAGRPHLLRGHSSGGSGMRIVLSARSGILNVPYRVFIPCVLVSATIWAAIIGLFPAPFLLGLGLLLIG
jgi:hypothetical protein